MRVHAAKRHWRAPVGAALVLAIALLFVAGCLQWPQGPGLDDIREGISLAEAQALAPFPICVPTVTPLGAQAVPSVIYHADFGDPMESDVRLRYYDLDGQELLIEIYQRHSPGASTPEDITDDIQDYYVHRLIAWQVGWDMEWSEIEAIGDEVSVSLSSYSDDNIDGWLYEITEPDSLRANLISWGNDPVAYLVYTRLSAEGAKEVVRSLPDVSECDIELAK